MKKLFVIALAATLVVMFTVPATAAVKHKFGGYWRTRFGTYDSLNFLDTGAKTRQEVDTRTRLYYTAVLHDNLKLVNKFEMDADWGDGGTEYGDIGADGIAVEVKNTYAQFNFANLEWKIGTQGFADATGGMVYDDDASGMNITYRADNYIASLRWFRAAEGGTSNNGQDYDILDLIFNLKAGNFGIAPFITYMKSNDGSGFDTTYGMANQAQDLYFLGARFNTKFGNFKWHLSGVYESGDANDTMDVTAYALDTKLSGKWGQWGAFVAVGYYSGDDNTTDNDIEHWFIPEGFNSMSNYSELWGDGKFQMATPDGTPGTHVTDLMAAGLGATYKMNKTWSFKAVWWLLQFAEDGANSSAVAMQGATGTDKDIGNEIDLYAKWKIMKALNLDFYFAYLILGDGLEPATNSQDPWELGGLLSLKF